MSWFGFVLSIRPARQQSRASAPVGTMKPSRKTTRRLDSHSEQSELAKTEAPLYLCDEKEALSSTSCNFQVWAILRPLKTLRQTVGPLRCPCNFDQCESGELKNALSNDHLHSNEGYVMTMYSPSKSTSEDLKGIIETSNYEYSIRHVHKN